MTNIHTRIVILNLVNIQQKTNYISAKKDHSKASLQVQ